MPLNKFKALVLGGVFDKPFKKRVHMKISGKFSLLMKSIESYADSVDGIKFARKSIDKIFLGELSATSKGEMLNALSPKAGSGGYVAIELVTGELNGKKGSFALQHFGTMSSENLNLILEVIPDSGTNELKNLKGKMSLNTENDQHNYIFEYEL